MDLICKLELIKYWQVRILCSEFAKHIDAESLLKNIQSDTISKDIKVDTGIYLKLVTLLRDINDDTDR
jgi:hypothetical protein